MRSRIDFLRNSQNFYPNASWFSWGPSPRCLKESKEQASFAARLAGALSHEQAAGKERQLQGGQFGLLEKVPVSRHADITSRPASPVASVLWALSQPEQATCCRCFQEHAWSPYGVIRLETGDCTYQLEFSGEILIDELVGITEESGNYANFINTGGREPRLQGFQRTDTDANLGFADEPRSTTRSPTREST